MNNRFDEFLSFSATYNTYNLNTHINTNINTCNNMCLADLCIHSFVHTYCPEIFFEMLKFLLLLFYAVQQTFQDHTHQLFCFTCLCFVSMFLVTYIGRDSNFFWVSLVFLSVPLIAMVCFSRRKVGSFLVLDLLLCALCRLGLAYV